MGVAGWRRAGSGRGAVVRRRGAVGRGVAVGRVPRDDIAIEGDAMVQVGGGAGTKRE